MDAFVSQSPAPDEGGKRKLLPRARGASTDRVVAYVAPALATRLAVYCAQSRITQSQAVATALELFLQEVAPELAHKHP